MSVGFIVFFYLNILMNSYVFYEFHSFCVIPKFLFKGLKNFLYDLYYQELSVIENYLKFIVMFATFISMYTSYSSFARRVSSVVFLPPQSCLHIWLVAI